MEENNEKKIGKARKKILKDQNNYIITIKNTFCKNKTP